MKRQLQLVVALALFGICLLAANATAGGINLGSGEGSVNIDLGDGSSLPSVELPVCSNLKDDDGDGKLDLLDPGCAGPGDGDETDPAAPPPEEPPVVPEVPPVDGDDGGDSGGGGGGGGKGDEFDQVPGQSGQGKGGGGKGGGKADDPKGEDEPQDPDEPLQPPEDRNPDGSPTNSNPSVTIADYGAAPMGVPNFVIDQFTIPPFLLPIYQACGTQYGVPWEVLASINRIETAFGTNLNVSSAGALGWMQFIPSSWEAYGVDANNDGRKDPYNPVDAICAAANYLDAAGAKEDLARAIFAYNHADWYVDEVLLYARQYGKIPEDLVGSLTGLTEGAHFPVAAKSRYADDISEREALARATPKKGEAGNAADVISSSPTERGINIYSREGAPVVAVNDGVIKRMGKSDRLGRYIVLEDSYGNRFTYAELGEVAEAYPVPKRRKNPMRDIFVESEEKPTEAASAGKQPKSGKDEEDSKARASGPANTEDSRTRLYAFPERAANEDQASLTGQIDDLLNRRMPGYDGVKSYFSSVLRFDDDKMDLAKLEEGSKVVAGTILGRVGKTSELAPHLHFEIRPTGRGAPKIDPKPILDGWKLLEATAIYRAAGKNPFAGAGATTGQILLMSKEQLTRRVLQNNRLELSGCDLNYIRSGQIDRRVLAAMEFLTARGYRLTITSMLCGRETSITTSGNVSNHSYGGAIDIAQINGIPVLGNQGDGSITESLVRDVLELQGTMVPDEVISLMSFGGPSFAMGDHHDHVHIGYRPTSGPESSVDKQFIRLLEPEQWERLIDRIGKIDNPTVPTKPSKYSLPANKRDRASAAHVGE
ncbi:MAG: lytic murein transglycosylase [Actinomycetota bacterium]|nr:lytic murein transglycosylase [Actinomycetota bacterium]